MWERGGKEEEEEEEEEETGRGATCSGHDRLVAIVCLKPRCP